MNVGIPEQYHQLSYYLARVEMLAVWACMKARLKTRVSTQTGCPTCYCAGGLQKVKSLPSLADHKPECMSEWHPTLNGQKGIHAHSWQYKDGTVALQEIPKGDCHAWKQSLKARQYSSCHFCTHRKVCACNALQSCFPDLAAEMDNPNNQLTPAQVTSKSNLMVQWKSAEQDTWMQRVHRRTVNYPN